MIDPYLTRAALRTVLSQPLRPDETAVRARLPARVDAVLCGHSHFDHLLDAPLIASVTGAKLVGSLSTCAFGRAAGLPDERLAEVGAGGRELSFGDIKVRFVSSRHGKIFLGRVPFAGAARTPVGLPARVWEYRAGDVFGILLSAGGTSIYHNGSADLVDAELSGEHADVVLAGIAGRSATRDYVKRLCRFLTPTSVVPTHHDAFFAPLEMGVHLLPGIDVEGFASEVKSYDPRIRVVTPMYDETICCFGSEGAYLAS